LLGRFSPEVDLANSAELPPISSQHSQIEIEQALITFSREQHGGLIAMPHTVTVVPLQKSGCLC
jgi:hypothetical protein